MRDGKLFFVILLAATVLGFFLYKRNIVADTASSPAMIENVVMERINSLIDQAKIKLNTFSDVQDRLKEAIKSVSYNDSKLIIPIGEEEISFDFNFKQHGPVLEGFKGVVAKVKLTGDFAGWEPLFEEALKSLKVKLSPAGVGIAKFVLLCKDTVGGKIEQSEFIMQMMGVFSRFTKTEGFNTFSSAMETIFSPIRILVQKIKFKGKSVSEFFDAKYQKFKNLVDRKFPKMVVSGEIVKDEAYMPNGSKLSSAKARGVMMALIIKCYTFYSELKRKFEESDAGIEAARIKNEALTAAEAMTNAAQKSAKKLEARTAYNSSLPGFDDWTGFLVVELAKILDRLEDSSAKDAILNVFSGLFSVFGIDFNMILTRVADETPPPEPVAPEVEEPEYDDSLDDFEFDDFDF